MSSDRPPTIPPIDGDPLASISKGATEGALGWTEEKIKQLARRFIDRDLYFIEDQETIDIAKETRGKGEFGLFKIYVSDKDLHILFQMGLTLRSLERSDKGLSQLIKKIRGKYQQKGLHVAHFVQNGLFGKYLGNIVEIMSSEEDIKKEIKSFFDNIENRVAFISTQDNADKKIREIVTKLNAHSPDTFIISSVGEAQKNCDKIKKGVTKQISENYLCERYESEQKDRQIFFLNKIDTPIPF